MPLGLGIWELVILLGIIALLFGAKGVPQIARRLGGSVREVREAVGEVDPRRMLEAPAEPKPPARPAATAPRPASTPRPPDDSEVG